MLFDLHRYKWEAFRKMRRAFAKGYDPVLELASAAAYTEEGELKAGRVLRKEQEYISRVINGESEFQRPRRRIEYRANSL